MGQVAFLPEPESQTTAMPHNRDAEEAVIASILKRPTIFEKLADIITSDDFYIHRFRFFWKAAESLRTSGQPITMIGVADQLRRDGKFEDFGGDAALFSISSNGQHSASEAESHAITIRDYSTVRKMIMFANTVAADSLSGKPVTDLLAATEKNLSAIAVRGGWRRSDIVDMSSALRRMDRQMELAADGTATYIETGYIDLDAIIGGFFKTDFIVVAGRPGKGKTSLVLNWIRNSSVIGVKHIVNGEETIIRKTSLIFSLEMSVEQLSMRLVSMETGISTDKMRKGKMSDDEWPLYANALGNLEDKPIYMVDLNGLTIAEMRLKMREAMAKYQPDIVYLDYIGLMSEPGQDNRVQEVSFITRNLKMLAREFQIPVVAAAQMNRAVEARGDKEPFLSDLRESGSIEQDADIVMFVYSDDSDVQTQNVRKVKIAKHRNGGTGTIELIFRANMTRFENCISRTINLREPTPHYLDRNE